MFLNKSNGLQKNLCQILSLQKNYLKISTNSGHFRLVYKNFVILGYWIVGLYGKTF